MTSLDEAQGP